MIHPSYVELMEVVNQGSEDFSEEPVINSRYSIVIASARRARQLIDGAEPKIETKGNRKALSVAVDEIYEQKVHIIGEDDDYEAALELSEETEELMDEADELFEEAEELAEEAEDLIEEAEDPKEE